MPSQLRDELASRLLSLPGVEERKSRWQDAEAFWYGGKEFLHFDQPDLVDLRLGRKTIRRHANDLLNDERIQPRGQSDWLNVRLRDPGGLDLVIGLVSELVLRNE